MLRQEFLGLFLGFIIKKAEFWLPEEATEDLFLDIMRKMIVKHNSDIKKILKKGK